MYLNVDDYNYFSTIIEGNLSNKFINNINNECLNKRHLLSLNEAIFI